MMRWYVLQVYSGYEETVEVDLRKRVAESEVSDQVGQILIPAAKFQKLFEDPEAKDQRLFPGYVLIQMELSVESMRVVNSCPRVLRFLGGKEPMPIAKKEIERILSQVKGEIAVGKETTEFILVGSDVEIEDGPFAGFVGVVEKVDHENERLTVMVSIFGRMTPVELGFQQIKR